MSRLRPCAIGAVLLPVAVTLAACQPAGTQTSQKPPISASAAAPGSAAAQAAPKSGHPVRPANSIVRHIGGQPMPDAGLTPGEAFPGVGPGTFCVSGYTKHVRDVSTAIRRQVFAEYQVPYAQHAAYEVDHLIPLELGGDNSIANLWPEKGSRPNPKDGLENQLHNLVCRGELSTATAQHAIATNWVAALNTYGSSSSVYDAPAPSPKPRGSAPAAQSPLTNSATAKCKDGSYSYAAGHQGTCSYHGGVATWYR